MKLSQLSREAPDKHEAELAELFLARIMDILDDGKCNWARDTLEGIHETVTKTGKITEGQRRAVNNIEARSHR